ncbi:MAG: EF-hand domain-containing protein [Rhodocyclaceae bacterium]|nr:EF-hand domain-containing protein [Rhodocyclaceae bacterium]
MSSIGAVGSNNAMMYGAQMRQRPDPSAMAEKLFSALDTDSQGYIEQADLETAFGKIGTDANGAAELFAQLDGDGDGKVTQDEFSSAMQAAADELDAQFGAMRMQGGMPPPPPPADDAGFTQEELASQLSEIGDSDSQRADLISNILANFEAADADGDGKVSFQEALAYDEENRAQSSGAASATAEPGEQFGAMRAAGGMPPPPPSAGDAGFTQEELESQLSEIGDGDSQRAGLISNIVANFEAADADGDGKVSFQEAHAYDEENRAQNAGSTSTAASAADTNGEAKLLMQLARLIEAYGLGDDGGTRSATLSIAA